jgi:hypothetical protein
MTTPASVIPPSVGTFLSFDEIFARLVRVTGWGLGVYAVIAKVLQGTEVVALITFFVGFQLVARFRDRKLEELAGKRTDEN